MILARLKEYADTRMELPPEMYGETPVRWLIDLTPDGELLGFVPRGGDTKANARGVPMTVPQIVRASGIKPKLLADNGEYVLGVGRPDADPAKVAERHRRFIELASRCAEETEEPAVEAVVRFLGEWNPERDRGRLPEGFDAGDTLTFRVNGVLPVELESVQRFWASTTAGEEGPAMTCLVTGLEGPVVDRLPVKIKGVPGGQTSGTSLVSANAEAFTSYGLKNSLTSPISRLAGERFGKALNELISKRDSRIYIGPLVYVFWTREETGFDPIGFVDKPQPEAVRQLFDSARAGRQSHGVRPNDFYALALSASGGRAVVRDWLETTVPEVQENLRRWFEAQSVVNAYGEKADPLGVYPLAASAYRDASKEMTATVPAALVRAALNGGRLPEDLLARAVRRNRAGTVYPDGRRENVTHQRAALMKLVLIYGGGEVQATEKLDTQHTDPAYHCGRLLAELEALQVAAIPGVKATIVDRYYGSASSTPAAVFGTLLSRAQSHLGKLRKSSGGAGAAIQERLEEISTSIGDRFPNTLTLREQAVFALGYYHQRAHNRARRRAAREARDMREES